MMCSAKCTGSTVRVVLDLVIILCAITSCFLLNIYFILLSNKNYYFGFFEIFKKLTSQH